MPASITPTPLMADMIEYAPEGINKADTAGEDRDDRAGVFRCGVHGPDPPVSVRL